MILEFIGAFVSGLSHRLGTKLGDRLTRSKQEESRRLTAQPEAIQNMSDQEIWNIVTLHGKYKEVWQIYRNEGLLEAIRVRDEKFEFDINLEKVGKPIQSPTSLGLQNSPPKSAQPNIPQTRVQAFQKSHQKLDELDLALVRGLASYFEEMDGKISYYHQDHHASREEADVIANYYLRIADNIRRVKTQQDLEELLKSIENLKEKVRRYQHKNYKYRWSTGLEKEVISKLSRIVHK